MSNMESCPNCDGSGIVYEDAGGGNVRKCQCERCDGAGMIEEEEK